MGLTLRTFELSQCLAVGLPRALSSLDSDDIGGACSNHRPSPVSAAVTGRHRPRGGRAGVATCRVTGSAECRAGLSEEKDVNPPSRRPDALNFIRGASKHPGAWRTDRPHGPGSSCRLRTAPNHGSPSTWSAAAAARLPAHPPSCEMGPPQRVRALSCVRSQQWATPANTAHVGSAWPHQPFTPTPPGRVGHQGTADPCAFSSHHW